MICGCGIEMGSCRKLLVGDILSALVDVSEGWCDVNVNDGEFSYRFNIPIGTYIYI
jgi:hypothetical protein